MSALSSGLRQECQWLLLALQFFTRIPVRLLLPFKEVDLDRTSRYISVVGLIVAAFGIAGYQLGVIFYGPWGGALLATVSTILVTGSFHEDGLADAADGLGGGLSAAQTLLIMKDSRIGTYGTLVTVISLITKIILLSQLSVAQACIALCLQHVLSRTLAISVMLSLPYAQEDALSKVKPVAKSLLAKDMRIAAIVALMPCLLLPLAEFMTLLLTMMSLRWLAIIYLRRRLGGYTGDCLGAIQQLAELNALLVLVAYWNPF